MNVKELKKILESVDDNRIVIMSKDSEGNSYSPLANMNDKSTYLATSIYSGEVGLEGVPALVLWPIN